MSRKALSLVLALIVGLLSFSVAAAQETTPEPTPQGEMALSDVIGNKAEYYGQQITVEGTIEELVNVDAFVVGDQAALSDHQLLVINNSGQPFDLGIKQDQKVRLIGTLYPSYNDGGWLELVGANTVNGPSPTEQAGVTPAITPIVNGFGTATVTPSMATESVGAMATAEMSMTEEMTPEMSMTEGMAPGMSMTEEMTPEMSMTEEMTPSAMMTPEMSMTEEMTAPVDLTQMFIPDDLRDYTILVLNGLHITYLSS